MFAWCPTNRSTSPTIQPASSSTAREDSAIRAHACRKTAVPCMTMNRSFGFSGTRCAAPPASTHSSLASSPSLCRSNGPSAPRSPGSPARSSTAPPPSPKIGTVVRSSGSTSEVKTSAPITSTRSAIPPAMNPAAVASA